MEHERAGVEDSPGETAGCLAEEEAEEEAIQCSDDLPAPPDGGFGWVIVVVAFLSGVVVDGIIFSFGIIYPEILKEFGQGPSQTAWVGSVLAGTYLLVGPLVSALANTFDCRRVAIAGSFVGGAAFIACFFFANNINFMIVVYGLFGGLGLGFIYLPPIVMVAQYFEKRRAFATGIAVCGSGVGTFIMSPVSQLLIDKYGWRGNLLIQAGIILNCAAICGFLRPLEFERPARRKRVERRDSVEPPPSPRRLFALQRKPKTKPLLQRIKEARDATMWESDSSLQSDNEDKEKIPLTVISNPQPPQDGAAVPPATGNNQHRNSLPPPNSDNVDAPNSDSNENYLNRTRPPQMTNRSKVISGEAMRRLKDGDAGRTGVSNHVDAVKGVSTSQPQLSSAIHHRNTVRRQSALVTFKEEPMPAHKKPWYHDIMANSPQKSALPKVTPENISRPFYRKDIFFSGSLLRIPEYTSASDVREYRKKVTYHPDHDSVDAGKSRDNLNMRETFKAMLDLSLLKDPKFFIMCLSGALTFLGIFIPFFYVADFAQSTGTSKENSAFLLSIIGIFNTVGRVICGWISDRPWANAFYIYVGALVAAGVSTALCGFCTIYATQVVFSCVFGFGMACYVSLRSIVLVDLMGLEKLTNSFGLTMLFQGTASMVGSPLAGFLYDSTGSYIVSFLTAGIIIVLSGVMLIILPCMNWWEERQRKRLELDTSCNEETALQMDSVCKVASKRQLLHKHRRIMPRKLSA